MTNASEPFVKRFQELESTFHVNREGDRRLLDTLRLLVPLLDAVGEPDIHAVLADKHTILYQTLPSQAGLTRSSLGIEHVLQDNESYQATHFSKGCAYHIHAIPIHDASGGVEGVLVLVDGHQKALSTLSDTIEALGKANARSEFADEALSYFVERYGYEIASLVRVDGDGALHSVSLNSWTKVRQNEILVLVERLQVDEVPSNGPFRVSGDMFMRAVRVGSGSSEAVVFGKSSSMHRDELVLQDALGILLASRLDHESTKPVRPDSELSMSSSDLFHFVRQYLKGVSGLDPTLPITQDILQTGSEFVKMVTGTSWRPLNPVTGLKEILNDLTGFYSARGIEVTASGLDESIEWIVSSEDITLAAHLAIRSVSCKSIRVESRPAGENVALQFVLGVPIRQAEVALAELLLRVWGLSLNATDMGFEIMGPPFRPESENLGELTSKSVSVLVVDDDESLRELLADILESRQLKVYSAGSVGDALAILNSKHPDIIISDFGLPGQSGTDLAGIVKRKNSSIPFILISGWGTDLTLSADEQRSVDYILSKPFNLHEVLDTFDRCIQELGVADDR